MMVIKKRIWTYVCTGLLTLSGYTFATPFTMTSPTSEGALSSAITEVGGVVLDIVGLNGARVTSQLASSGLYDAYNTTNTIIGTQTGFTGAISGALGGGIAEAAVRISLYDGDNASGNFDFNDNTFFVNSLSFGNWSDVIAQNTDPTGTIGYSFSSGGFRDSLLDTGWFFSNDLTLLGLLYDSIVSTEQLIYSMYDVDGGDNYLDFTQGVDGGLVDVASAPTVSNPTSVPEPGTIALFCLGLMGLLFRKKINMK